jgi:hypothetical protein
MKLRIWHHSNFDQPAFYRTVASVEQALDYLDLLAYYDLYLGEQRVFCNAQGIEIWNEQDKQWENFYDDDGNELEDLRRLREAHQQN